MTTAEAGQVLAFLNAAFPRDALEPESAAIWVREIASLRDATAAQAAARTIGRNGDRFPTLKEFRATYRTEHETLMSGRQLAEPVGAPPPPEAVAMLARMRTQGLRSIDDLPATTSMTPRPVWARWLKRFNNNAWNHPLSDDERHDAILVLREAAGTETGDARLLVIEAQRIMDECST